jgi:hypothetical protein
LSGLQTDQFAKPGILPPDSKRLHASKRARQSRATFVATSTYVLAAAAHPGAGTVLQTTQLLHGDRAAAAAMTARTPPVPAACMASAMPC